MVVDAIHKAIASLQEKYNNLAGLRHSCHVVFSLRKCTYELLDPTKKIGRPDANDAYFLRAANFEDVIRCVIKSLESNRFLDQHRSDVYEVIGLVSSRISTIFSGRDGGDTFDNNYRRRLRFISSIVIHAALRVSSRGSIRPEKGETIHQAFFRELREEVNGLPFHFFEDVLVYGVNIGFNNHFSQSHDRDNLGARCGFVDNIFCYFGDAINNGSPTVKAATRFILKLKVLQILKDASTNATDPHDRYLSVKEITEELSAKARMRIPVEPLSETLDFLEKALFVRSTKSAAEPGTSYPSMKFKCSNHGMLLLNTIIKSYSYITAVAQNSCMPMSLSKRVKYHNKSMNDCGSRFLINKAWKLQILPTVLLFLRLLKHVEDSHGGSMNVATHLVVAFREALTSILAAPSSGLSLAEKKKIYDQCKEVVQLA